VIDATELEKALKTIVLFIAVGAMVLGIGIGVAAYKVIQWTQNYTIGVKPK
jgi:hypothetical protein